MTVGASQSLANLRPALRSSRETQADFLGLIVGKDL